MNNKRKIIVAFIFLFCCLTFTLINTGLQKIDDEIYKNAFYDYSSFFNWITFFYNNWSGRIVVSTLTTFFTNMPTYVFLISNITVFFIFIITIYFICNIMFENIEKKLKLMLLCCIPCFFYFMKLNVIKYGVIWLTGALNYFWPATFMLVSLIPFISELKSYNIKSKYYIIFLLANIISAMVEQTGLVLVCFGIITLILLKKENRKINKLLIIHLIIIILLFGICILAPGNVERKMVEELQWYNDFSMLSLFEKVNQGFRVFLDHTLNDNIILTTYFILQLIYLKSRNESKTKLDILFIVSLSVYIIWANLFRENEIFNLASFEIKKMYKYIDIIKIILNYIITIHIGIELLYIMKNSKNSFIVSLLYSASVCAIIILGFSPTIYASGDRIFLLTDFLIILINSLLSIEIFKEEKNKKLAKLYLTITTILALVTYIICF